MREYNKENRFFMASVSSCTMVIPTRTPHRTNASAILRKCVYSEKWIRIVYFFGMILLNNINNKEIE